MRALLESERHRQEFQRVLADGDHPAFMAATKHAAAYAEGLPVQHVEMNTSPQQNETGEVVMQRLAAVVLFLPSDDRAKALKELRAAEEIVVEPKPKKGAKP